MDDLERVARFITARKMGLVKDPQGLRLPEELWKRSEDRAAGLLKYDPVEGVLDWVDAFIEPIN